MDVEGVRLGAKGWYEADGLFAKASKYSRPKVIVVIAKDFAVSTSSATSSPREFYFGYEEVGQISVSSLVLTLTRDGLMNEFQKYQVVEDRDETENSRPPNNERPRWKIDGNQSLVMHLNARAAIRYLREERRRVADPIVRKNADHAVSQLSRFP